jgi:hypothetical protein
MRSCASCSKQFNAAHSGPGKPRLYCSAKCRNKTMRRTRMLSRQCVECGSSFVTEKRSGGKTAVVCSMQCKVIRRRRIISQATQVCVCMACGKQFAKRSRQKDSNRFCSRHCAGTAKKEMRETEHHKRIFAIADGFLHVMLKWVRIEHKRIAEEQKRIAAEESRGQRIRRAIASCKKCGKDFERVEGRRGAVKRDCRECTMLAKKQLNKAHKLLRKARLRGSDAVKVNPDDIFKRDKWRCQLCGRKVTKKVSPNDDRYPNLDHVIPACDLGPHRPDNLQCLCRACNLAKSDKRLNLF